MAKLGVNEDNPDVTERAIYLGYLQATYNELYGEVAATFPSALLALQNVTLSSGVGTLNPRPFQIVSVVDTTNNYGFVQPTTFSDYEATNPQLTPDSNPSWYWQEGLSNITTNSAANNVLRVSYIPNPGTLVDGTTGESDLFIPVPFQDVLLWGAMRYVRMDESDKMVGPELQSSATMYEVLKGNFFYWLKNGQVRQQTHAKKYFA